MITVCMATCNGQKYIEEQLLSITSQLAIDDECIIVDDFSTDNTYEIISRASDADPRIKISRNEVNIGPLRSFERAITAAKGEFIFLADQDDIWLDDKINFMRTALQTSGRAIVVSDARIIDENGRLISPSFYTLRHSGRGFLKNFYKNTYLGCCMAFHADLKSAVLPFPPTVAQHDEWVGLIGELVGGVQFLPKVLLSYRRHSSNTSSMSRYPLRRILRNRVMMAGALLHRYKTIIHFRKQWRKS